MQRIKNIGQEYRTQLTCFSNSCHCYCYFCSYILLSASLVECNICCPALRDFGQANRRETSRWVTVNRYNIGGRNCKIFNLIINLLFRFGEFPVSSKWCGIVQRTKFCSVEFLCGLSSLEFRAKEIQPQSDYATNSWNKSYVSHVVTIVTKRSHSHLIKREEEREMA